jgi:HTH-type transcriptional regulator/antitoxin HigA
MTTKIAARKLPDTYFALVRQLPLKHIRNVEQLIAAQSMVDRLLQTHRDTGAEEYLDVLTDLIELYENEHEAIQDAAEGDVLRELMRSNGLNQANLSQKVGIAQSTISAVLNGARSLTKQQILALASYFRVAPAAFLPEGK